MTAIKIKSHLDETAALQAGVERLHWRANSLADELAEAAALEAQLPPEAVMAVQAADRKAYLVQEHLLAVAAAVAQDAARLYGPSTRLERAREARARGLKSARRSWRPCSRRRPTGGVRQPTGASTALWARQGWSP